MQKIRVLLLVITSVILIFYGKKYASIGIVTQTQYVITGFAFFNAFKFIGRPTVSVQLYEPNKLIGAYRIITFGARLTFASYQNGKAAKVTIIHKEPFVANRIVNVSKAAARLLGMINASVVNVRLTYY